MVFGSVKKRSGPEKGPPAKRCHVSPPPEPHAHGDAPLDWGVFLKQLTAQTVTDTITQMGGLVNEPLARIQDGVDQAAVREAARYQQLHDGHQALQYRVGDLERGMRATAGDDNADTDALQESVGRLARAREEVEVVVLAAGLQRRVRDLEGTIRTAMGDPNAEAGALAGHIQGLRGQIPELEREKQTAVDEASMLRQIYCPGTTVDH